MPFPAFARGERLARITDTRARVSQTAMIDISDQRKPTFRPSTKRIGKASGFVSSSQTRAPASRDLHRLLSPGRRTGEDVPVPFDGFAWFEKRSERFLETSRFSGRPPGWAADDRARMRCRRSTKTASRTDQLRPCNEVNPMLAAHGGTVAGRGGRDHCGASVRWWMLGCAAVDMTVVRASRDPGEQIRS